MSRVYPGSARCRVFTSIHTTPSYRFAVERPLLNRPPCALAAMRALPVCMPVAQYIFSYLQAFWSTYASRSPRIDRTALFRGWNDARLCKHASKQVANADWLRRFISANLNMHALKKKFEGTFGVRARLFAVILRGAHQRGTNEGPTNEATVQRPQGNALAPLNDVLLLPGCPRAA